MYNMSDVSDQVLQKWEKLHPVEGESIVKKGKTDQVHTPGDDHVNWLIYWTAVKPSRRISRLQIARLNDKHVAHTYKVNENSRDFTSRDIRRLVNLLFPKVGGFVCEIYKQIQFMCVCVCVCVCRGVMFSKPLTT